MKITILIGLVLATVCLKADWAEEQLASMSTLQKVGQIFMPSLLSTSPDCLQHMAQLITQYHVGGVLLLTSSSGERQTPCQQAELINQLQRYATMPLLIAQDLEWGLSMRLKNVVHFPHNMTLGAIENKELVYDLGKEIGRQCNLMGVHINFAPVVDVNSNPNNPVINDRAFGSDIHQVAQRALLFMNGMRDAGVISCAKHFPGHGDTDVDSHYDLPVIKHTRAVLEARELYPFKRMIEARVPMIMTAHVHVPALDDTGSIPSSLSKAIVTDLLKDRLGFTGIIVTDGLRMGGISNTYSSGQAAVMAIEAGNDLLIDSEDPVEAIKAVLQAVRDGVITEERLDISVLKILRAKQSVGLDKYVEQPVPALDQFHTKYAYQLKGQLFGQAITLVRDNDALLPVKPNAKCAALFIEEEKSLLHKRADSTPITVVSLAPDASNDAIAAAEQELTPFETIVVGIFGMNKYAHKQFGIRNQTRKLISRLQTQDKKVVVVLFGSPYAVSLFDDVGTLLVAYEDDVDAQFVAARVIVGNAQANGQLPV